MSLESRQSPEPKIPRFFTIPRPRRKVFANTVKGTGVVVAAEVAMAVGGTQEQFPLPFIPLNYEGITELGIKTRFSKETVQKGVRVIVFGDSIQAGYQGTTVVDKKTRDKPYTPPSGYVVDRQVASGRNWEIDMHAEQGETSAQTLAKIKAFRKNEYLARLRAKREGKPYDPRPLWIWHSDNGNDLRIPASDPKINADAQKLDRDGPLRHPQEFGEVTQAMSKNTVYTSNNILASLIEIRDMAAGLPPEGVDETEVMPVPIAGLEVLLTYDKAEVPTMQFIPVTTNGEAMTRRTLARLSINQVIKKVFNLANDGMARWAAHVGSQDTINAYKYALQRFRIVAGPMDGKVSAFSMGPFVKHNNGTEHLSPKGDWLLALAIEKNTEVYEEDKSTTNLYAITPLAA